MNRYEYKIVLTKYGERLTEEELLDVSGALLNILDCEAVDIEEV